MKKKLLFLIGFLSYILIGLLFTILRSNAHYDYFVLGDYWKERCKEENDYDAFIYGTPGARWCLINGKFMVMQPTRMEWYVNFYFYNEGNYNGGFVSTILFWPIHFLGNDIIHFKSIGWVGVTE